jgi:hypothetical protein
MTTNDALTAEPSSLAFDTAPLGAALRTIASNKEPLMRYVAAVRAIPLGEQPIVIGGNVVSHYDVLSKRPELKSALWNALQRANDLAGNMDTLHIWAASAAVNIVGEITPLLESVSTILAAVPSGGSINPADLQRIREKMQMVTVHVWMVRMAMDQVSRGIKNFVSNIFVDHDTFAAGPLELHKVRAEVGQQISDEAMPYVLKPVTSGIGNAMLEVGRAFLATIDGLIQVLGNALVGHEAMQGAASALATAASTAWTKYEAGASAVWAADAAKMSVTLRKMQLTEAIESWKQFATFFSKSNL